MNSARVTRRVEFDSGHRVPDHNSKCRNIHGHRYILEATVSGSIKSVENNSDDGMVIDFGVLKAVMQSEIADVWDHGCLLAAYDPLCAVLQREFPGFKIVKFADPPTAECLAREAYDALKPKLSVHGLELVSVRLYETPNAWADFGAET